MILRVCSGFASSTPGTVPILSLSGVGGPTGAFAPRPVLMESPWSDLDQGGLTTLPPTA